MKKKFVLLYVIPIVTLFLMGHGGGLDKNGCHNDKKQGNYHCHRGPDAGKTFKSKAEYEKQKKK